jgi:hypothetical protein
MAIKADLSDQRERMLAECRLYSARLNPWEASEVSVIDDAVRYGTPAGRGSMKILRQVTERITAPVYVGG